MRGLRTLRYEAATCLAVAEVTTSGCLDPCPLVWKDYFFGVYRSKNYVAVRLSLGVSCGCAAAAAVLAAGDASLFLRLLPSKSTGLREQLLLMVLLLPLQL